MKFSTLTAAAALAAAAIGTPAFAQDNGLTVGGKIYGPDGAEVATIEQVQDGAIVINTGSVTAALPADAFGTGDNGPTIGWNKAELEAAINAANGHAQAELEAALVADTDVYSSDDMLLGKITEVSGDGNVVVELETGPVALPGEQMALADGKLIFRATAADVLAAAAAAAGETSQGGD